MNNLATFSKSFMTSSRRPNTSPCNPSPWICRVVSVTTCSFTTASVAAHSPLVISNSLLNIEIKISRQGRRTKDVFNYFIKLVSLMVEQRKKQDGEAGYYYRQNKKLSEVAGEEKRTCVWLVDDDNSSSSFQWTFTPQSLQW